MARRMLIDASQPEETRVVVVDGTRLEEFDFETASRKPLKGNIYLAKVIRIEPSLQAAFVEYGGNRHGFLAFSEIHPDYYQIPVADRERLLAEQQRAQADAEEQRSERAERRRHRIDRTDIEEAREGFADAPPPDSSVEPIAEAGEGDEAHPNVAQSSGADASFADHAASDAAPALDPVVHTEPAVPAAIEQDRLAGPALSEATDATLSDEGPTLDSDATLDLAALDGATPPESGADPADAPQPEIPVETLGGDEVVEEREARARRRRTPSVRQYKIQEVIKRRQILLVQVVKEERGNKGAALTTYLSLAGRYCVLMPNAGRGGGISRKISNPSDRKRMKELLAELDVPSGMGAILRTAGLERSKIEIRRDYEYLVRLWESIRDITLRSTAPALIYEEGDLVKRSLRDVYDTDIAQVLVEGEAGFQAASEFMRQLVPHEAGKVELYREPIPLLHRYQVESQLDAMHSPTVQLRSGGYIVINPTEALVAIDVNSGRATKERNIEETALRTNIEAAEEIARQIRLRDLAGLIVIDFIDMEETRHQRQVEGRLKDAMRTDRARIQIGRISAFGLLELSRQRLRPSLLEHSTDVCPHCAGTGRIRSVESAALHAMRSIEEEGVRRRASEITVSVPPPVALYLLNQKRRAISEIEQRYGFTVLIDSDEELHAADLEIERTRSRRDDRDRPAQETARARYEEAADRASGEEPDDATDEAREDSDEEHREGSARFDSDGDGEGDGDGSGRRRRRRRRRRGGRRDDDDNRGGEGVEARRSDARHEDAPDAPGGDGSPPADQGNDRAEGEPRPPSRFRGEGDGDAESDGNARRRRGRRGGRRRRRDGRDDRPERGDGSFDGAPRDEHAADDRPMDDAREVAGSETVMAREPVEVAAPSPREERPAPPPVSVPVVAVAPPPPPPPAPEAPPVPSIQGPAEKPKRGWWSR